MSASGSTLELVIDSFAGGGGASEGIRAALGPSIQKRKCKHGLSYAPEYRAWQMIRLRCLDPKHAAYPNYGGRGIGICDRWLSSPQAFISDMGPRPSPKHEIDRIDNGRGYEPGNCRWATRTENCRNRRSNRMLEFRGETLSLAEWCDRLGLPRDTVRKRLDSDWSVVEALTAGVRSKLANGAGRRDGRQTAAKVLVAANYKPRRAARRPEPTAAPLLTLEAAE